MAANGNWKSSIFVPVLVALIAGALAAIPAILGFIITPRQIQSQLRETERQIEGNLDAIRTQSREQLILQRDEFEANLLRELLGNLDDPQVNKRIGAAISLAVLGGMAAEGEGQPGYESRTGIYIGFSWA